MIGINEIASTVIQIVHRRINKIIEIHMYMNKNINYSTGPTLAVNPCDYWLSPKPTEIINGYKLKEWYLSEVIDLEVSS